MRSGTRYAHGARLVEVTHTGKLAPVTKKPFAAIGPFASATDVSISATCSDTCAFKSGGCYVRSGRTKVWAARLDRESRSLSDLRVIGNEVGLIDGAFHGGPVPQDGARGGRDLRLHVGGDVGSAMGAALLAGAARRWTLRGGGAVWTFTHWWRDIPREAFGSISVLASVERPEDIELARKAGYAAAIVVPEFPSPKAFLLPGSTAKIIPCPAETKGTTCVQCRLCLDAGKLLERNQAIAFKAHGPTKGRVVAALVQLRTSKQSQLSVGDKSLDGRPRPPSRSRP